MPPDVRAMSGCVFVGVYVRAPSPSLELSRAGKDRVGELFLEPYSGR